MAYVWRNNNACVATYKVMVGDYFLDQFEESNVPFANAGAVKMGQLRYFPKTTNNSQLIEAIAYEKAGKFLTYVQKIFTVSVQDKFGPPHSIVAKLALIFADPQTTLSDLAQAIDGELHFPDEL